MEIEFHQQKYPDHITVGDEVELYNCEEHMMNGHYTVAIVEDDGEVTLVGKGRHEGTITTINMQG